jgi:hypothetical protein
MEERMVVWLAFPLLVILIFIGLAFLWMVHHHLWKPLMGILLLGAGLFFFSLLFSYQRFEERSAVMREEVRSADASHEMTLRQAELPLPLVKPKTSAAPKTDVAESERPAWINQQPHTDDDGVYVVAVTSGPYQTRAECDDALTAVIDKEICAFAEKLDPDAAKEPLSLDGSFRQSLIRQRYNETVDSSVGKMQQVDAQLAFTKQIQGELIRQIKQFVIDKRLKYAAAAGGVVLLMLGAAYSILRRPARTPEGSKPLAGG